MTIGHHFGPSVTEVGGMASVIRTFNRHTIGAPSVRVHATWYATSRRRTIGASFRALTTILRLPHSDAVHIHLSERGSFVREGALIFAARARGLPTVAHLHGADFAETAASHPILVRRVLSAATHISCLTPEALQIATVLAPKTNRRLIPNPVEVDTAAVSADETAPTVLFAGEIGRRKGIDVLAAAWPLVLERIPNAELIVVGPPGDLPMPRLPRVTVLPPADETRVRDLIRAARVVALPSRAEAMPMILLEAQASRRPYVATAVGGVEALTARGGGTLVNVGDHGALAEALIGYLGDPGRARVTGQRGQSVCREIRSPPVISRAYHDLLGSSAA